MHNVSVLHLSLVHITTGNFLVQLEKWQFKDFLLVGLSRRTVKTDGGRYGLRKDWSYRCKGAASTAVYTKATATAQMRSTCIINYGNVFIFGLFGVL